MGGDVAEIYESRPTLTFPRHAALRGVDQGGTDDTGSILRRPGSEGVKNKPYFVFRELGSVIRTMFLLRYIDDPELRLFGVYIAIDSLPIGGVSWRAK